MHNDILRGTGRGIASVLMLLRRALEAFYRWAPALLTLPEVVVGLHPQSGFRAAPLTTPPVEWPYLVDRFVQSCHLQPLRLLSVYTTNRGTRLCIITEANRNVTTLLLPSDY